MAMVRKQLYLTQELDQKVKRLAKARNVAEAEIVREALDSLVEYRLTDAAGRNAVRETATLTYGAAVMDSNERERALQKARKVLNSGAGMRVLEMAQERARELTGTEGGGRTWTRDDLYDERPKYLSH